MVDAFRRGALDAIPIIGGMLAVLLAFISLLEFVNATLTWFGDRVGIVDLTLQVGIVLFFFHSLPGSMD